MLGDLDNKDRVHHRLSPGLVGLASDGNVGDTIRIGTIGAYHSGLDLGIARPPACERRIDPGAEPQSQDAMRLCGRRHCHGIAVDQLVARIGPVVPTQELLKGHMSDRQLGHF